MRTVLIVEDNQLNLEMASDLLKRAGFQTLEALDANAGIQLAKAHHPDLILMDMHLPVKNGYEASLDIKADPTIREIPIIAFTALAMEEEQRRALAHGCSGIICKPIDVDHFAETVAGFMKLESIVNVSEPLPPASIENQPPEAEMRPSLASAQSAARVMIVDDHPQNVALLEDVLGHMCLSSLSVSQGAQVLELARREQPDLILLDIMMPSLNGYQVLEQLKADPDTVDIPVIFVSSLKDTDSIVTGLNKGGHDYITKPFQVEEVQARVSATLRAKFLQDALRRQVAEVERTRQDMEEFIYIASHDLQAPLRKIQQFTDFMRRPEVPGAGEKLDFINSIERNAREMEILLRALLQLSRVGRRGERQAGVSLTDLACEAVKEQQEAIDSLSAIVEVGDLPCISADSRQMQTVFAELLKNALKFHSPDRTPVIRIQSEALESGRHRITVTDNGIGFEQTHAELIFKPLQRLHGVGKYSGSGIGLAIVKRIIEAHGGVITVRSAPGEGTTFELDLP